MTADPPRAGAGTRLAFHGPLSEERALQLVNELTATTPATVLDIGCGWAELMLRILHLRMSERVLRKRMRDSRRPFRGTGMAMAAR